MIYGKITLEDWRTACVEGEEPESSFESYNLRLFFFGTLYNRDTLQATPDDTNAKLAADADVYKRQSYILIIYCNKTLYSPSSASQSV